MEKKSNLRVNTSYTFHIYIYLTIYFFVKYLWNILITHGICVLMKNMRSHSTVHVEVYLFCNKSADLIFFDHIAVSSSNCLKVRRLWNCANRVHSRRVQRRENKKKKENVYFTRRFSWNYMVLNTHKKNMRGKRSQWYQGNYTF